MKDKKGFTLIEMIVVVAILALIGTIVTISFMASLNNANQKQCDEFVLDIEEAACVYAGLQSSKEVCNRTSCTIKLSTLIDEGLLEETKDACTGNDIDLTKEVKVTWNESGEKICEYNGVKTYER